MTPRAHVVHVLPQLEWSGAEKVVAELAERLPALGFSTSVLGLETDQTSFTADLRKKGIAVSGLNLSRRRTLSCARALRQAVATMPRPLIVHAHMFHATLTARWALREIVRTDAVHTVSTTHIVERRFRPWHAWMDRWTAPIAACEICVSQAVRTHQESSTNLPAAFFRVIENGIPLARFLTIERPQSHSTLTAVSIGRLDAQKDFPTLLQAWSTVEQKLPSAQLKIAGRGPDEATLKALAAKLGLQRVEFLGFIEDIPALLRQGDVYLQTSQWEGFGLAVAEALAAGLPAVVTDADSLPQLVRHEGTGLVAPRDNAPEIAQALLRLFADKPLREQFGRAGREDARVRFDAQRMAAEHAALYESILNRKEK